MSTNLKKCKSGEAFCKESKSTILEEDVITPLGLYTIRACDKGIHFLSAMSVTDENFDPDANALVESKISKGASKPLSQGLDWLSAYFQNPKGLSPNIPAVCFPKDESTEFERKVWDTLADSALFGNTFSYAELADKIGNPKASRAVGTALKKNPVCLIIPCHRVIRSDGSIGNYSGGKRNKVKEWLLKYEEQKI